MKKYFLILVTILLTVFTSCEKNNDEIEYNRIFAGSLIRGGDSLEVIVSDNGQLIYLVDYIYYNLVYLEIPSVLDVKRLVSRVEYYKLGHNSNDVYLSETLEIIEGIDDFVTSNLDVNIENPLVYEDIEGCWGMYILEVFTETECYYDSIPLDIEVLQKANKN